MPAPDRMPEIVGAITLVIGGALVAAPQLATGPLGLTGRETAMRAIGAADLALVPGLLRGRPGWPWMSARAALNVAQAAYLLRVAPDAGKPALTRAVGSTLLGLTAADGATALALRRAAR
jgi:hypothetical protein